MNKTKVKYIKTNKPLPEGLKKALKDKAERIRKIQSGEIILPKAKLARLI